MNKKRHGNKVYAYRPLATMSVATYAAVVAVRKAGNLVQLHGRSDHKVKPLNGSAPWRVLSSRKLIEMAGCEA